MKSFGKEGSGDGEFVSPVGVCITGDGRFIVVTEFANSRIQARLLGTQFKNTVFYICVYISYKVTMAI